MADKMATSRMSSTNQVSEISHPGAVKEFSDFEREFDQRFGTEHEDAEDPVSKTILESPSGKTGEGSCDEILRDCTATTLNSAEDKDVREIYEKGCGCSRGPDKSSCVKAIPQSTAANYRYSVMELTKPERDLVILGQLSAHRTREEVIPTSHAYSRKRSVDHGRKFRPSCKFFFADYPICRKTFCFLHCIGESQYESLCKHLEENGVSSRVHGNTGNVPHHALGFEERVRIKNFIENAAISRGLPLPGRLPNAKDFRVTLLPSETTKTSLWRDYVAAAGEEGRKPCGITCFKDTWQSTIPDVKIMKPATDLCQTCQENNTLIIRSANLPDQVKQERMTNAMQHINQARAERDYYRDQCHTPVNNPKCVHLSFDYAQQVHYPFNCQQIGPAYFKTPRKCHIFGVSDEARAQQVNYLIDEADTVGKGANSVICMMHHYMDFHVNPSAKHETHLLHADNCAGQNKNNANLHYWLWRTVIGLSSEVEISFMMAGHTKFSPDRFFGLMKRQYNRSIVDTIFDIADVVRKSSPQGLNVPQLTVDPCTSTRFVEWYAWDTFLQDIFKPLPRITSFHHFRMSKNEKGVVYARHLCNTPEEKFQLLKVPVSTIDIHHRPSVVIPAGLSHERQCYLYEQIAPLCSNKLAASISCPKPATS